MSINTHRKSVMLPSVLNDRHGASAIIPAFQTPNLADTLGFGHRL
ncbi:hypothetical protein [Chamaesiphon sp.]